MIPRATIAAFLCCAATLACAQTAPAPIGPIGAAGSGGGSGGSGTVTSITAGTGLSGGTITTSGTIATIFGTAANQSAQGGVITAGGPTGSATVAPIITYNAAGQLTVVTSATITPAVGSITGLGTNVATALGQALNGSGAISATTSPTIASPTFTGTVTMPDASTITSSGYGSVAALGVGVAVPAAGTISANGIITTAAAGSASAPALALSGAAYGLYSPAASQLCFADVAGTCRGDYGITNGGQITLNASIVGTGNLSITSGSLTVLNTGNMMFNTRGIITSPAAATIVLGPTASATAATAQTLQAQGSSAASATGPNFTISGSNQTGTTSIGGNLVLQGGTGTSSNGIVNVNSQLTVTAMTQTAVAQSGTVCYNTTGGAVTYDATLGCLTSLEEMKDIHGPITGALAEVAALKPFWFSPINRPAGSDLAEQPGFGAHQVESVDPRLVGYGADGELRGVRYMEMTALLAAAIKEQQTEISDLKRRLQ
jgi:hypothetical protein